MIPINVDYNASSADIARIVGRPEEPSALIYQTFMTIQGEGPYAGRVAFFIRFGGCNLGSKSDCVMCDTSFEVESSTFTPLADLVLRAQRAFDCYPHVTTKDYCPLVVITGGEPFVQGESLLALVGLLHEAGFTVQIETNGYYIRKYPSLAPLCVVSPKASTSLGHYSSVYQPQDFANVLAVKFLLSADPSSLYHDLPSWWRQLTCMVLVSPIAEYLRAPTKGEGEVSSMWDASMIDRDATQNNYTFTACFVLDHCRENRKLQISIQQHLLYNLP